MAHSAQRPCTTLGGPRHCAKVCANSYSSLTPKGQAQAPDQHWVQLNFAVQPSCLDVPESRPPLANAQLAVQHFGGTQQARVALVASTRALRQGATSASQLGRRDARGTVRCRGIAFGGAQQQRAPLAQQQRLLLSEELELAQAVQRGRRIEREAAALATMGGQPPSALQLAQAAGFECAHTMEEALQQGWAAKQRLVDCNRGLVVHLAGKLRGLGLAMEDLISEGTAALEKAASAFSPERKARFSTFAGTVVFRDMLRAVYSCGRTITLPEHMHQSMQQVLAAKQRLMLFLDRQPTLGEVAQEAGLSLAELRRLERAFSQPTVSLVQAAALGSVREGQVEEEDVVADDGEDDGADLFRLGIVLDMVTALHTLKPDQSAAVVLRNGLAGGQPQTWKEVAGALQLTHQRAHKIHEAAVRQLRQQLVA